MRTSPEHVWEHRKEHGPVGLVMPCFNEAARLDPAGLCEALRVRPWLHLLVVDDGSTDATPSRLEALREAAPPGQVSILTLERNQGKAEAVRRGLLTLLARGGFDALGFWDADLSTPLSAVDRLWGALAEDPRRELVLGSRVRLLGRPVERRALRHYGGRVIATLISLGLDLPVYDSQCGAKLLAVTPGLPSLLERPFSSRWLFDMELLSRWLHAHPGDAWVHGLYEVPLPTWVHATGSKLAPVDALRAPLDVLAISLRHRRRR